MSIGADPQMTLRDYFTRHGGKKHVLITNINQDSIEFYVRPESTGEEEGMHFRLSMKGQLTEVGAWEQTKLEGEDAQRVENKRLDRDAKIDKANGNH